MQRVISYIDGFNLYYGLRSKRWNRFYWLNLQRLSTCYLKPGQTLGTTKYFTSTVDQPPDKHDRQNTYLEALQTLSNFSIFYGHYLRDQVTCFNCGRTYQTHHEKMTDVNIAVEILIDAFQNQFDVALLFSADSDLVAPIKAIKKFYPAKVIAVIFPPGRHSKELARHADAALHVGHNQLSRSLFPEKVTKPDGFVLQQPASWQ